MAGALFVVGTTAYAAVRAVSPAACKTIAIAGAAGGVGSIAVQRAQRTGATVPGIAGAHNHGSALPRIREPTTPEERSC